MNIISLSGGIGNQLFQIAFFLNHIKINQNTKLDISFYKDKNFVRLDEYLKLDLPIASETDLKLFKLDRSIDFYKKISIKIKMLVGLRVIKFLSKKPTYFHQGRFNLYKDYWTQFDWVYFDGTFFNYKMALNVIPEIHKFIENIYFPNNSINDIESILKLNTVAVHVRSGDYKDLGSQGFFVLGKRYYEAALSFIENKIDNPYYLLFSDSDNEIFDLFKNKNHIVIKFDSKYSAFYEFKIMSRCKNIIMANSSFSLWASYLIENDSRIIIGPNKWMKQYYSNTKEILPYGAKSINVDM
jgi:hypothetical protein